MWAAQSQELPAGQRYRLLQADSPLTFRQVFQLLGSDGAFREWYTGLLADCEFDAFYWEHPPLSDDNYDADAEFVVLDAPALTRMPPEPAAFADQFARQPDADVLVFPNLGGDAMLIVPRPVGAPTAYPHLAAFLRHAPTGQIDALWQVTATALTNCLGTAPRWLSTAGLGVAWLHLRIDTRPKYYSFAPYRAGA